MIAGAVIGSLIGFVIVLAIIVCICTTCNKREVFVQPIHTVHSIHRVYNVPARSRKYKLIHKVHTLYINLSIKYIH